MKKGKLLKNIHVFLLIPILMGWFFVSSYETVFAESQCSGGYSSFVPCGRSCDDPLTVNNETNICTLCHLFLVIKNISDWILRTMTYIALVILVSMGLLYIVSMQNGVLVRRSQQGIWTVLVGFAVILLGWVAVNVVLMILVNGSVQSRTATFSLKTNGSWFEFDCDTATKYATTTEQKKTDSQERDCSLYNKSSLIPPAGYGSPFDQLSGDLEPTLVVKCSESETRILAGSSYTYVYKSGFVFKENSWNKLEFSGSAVENNDGWIRGVATAELPVASSSETNFVIAFICRYESGKWKCGCRDRLCEQNYWTLQAYAR